MYVMYVYAYTCVSGYCVYMCERVYASGHIGIGWLVSLVTVACTKNVVFCVGQTWLRMSTFFLHHHINVQFHHDPLQLAHPDPSEVSVRKW